MISNKCKNCPALIIPYFGLYGKPQSELCEDLKVGTCKCNMDTTDRCGEGYYGRCHPGLCKGPTHKYYFDHSMANGYEVKFINE